MQKGDYISVILRSIKTVFTVGDIALLWGGASMEAARVRLNYYVRNGDLYRIRRGLYVKDKNYNKLELATRIFTPSYVSFETILAQAGLVFQYYDQIFIASYLTREVNIGGQMYVYRKIKDIVLTNSLGIEHINETSVATKERAFLDIIYINTDYHFDNTRSLDWDRVFEILPAYENKRMTKKVHQLFKQSNE